ncbi:MAG TPA: hypothetical protein VGB73_16655 [Pyrinomonadaceae bacterium]|jgi:hypothetical protein
MALIFVNRTPGRVWLRVSLCLTSVLFSCACASLSRPPEAGRPRAAGPPYPVILGASEERRDRALAAWTTLADASGIGSGSEPELQPVTATLRALPATTPAASLRLPKVGGEGAKQTEEELREALRRFIADAAPLLGVVPTELSLVERADNADSTRRARYQQRPFLYPLRAGYGVLEINFTPDLRVTAINSTAIPDTERLRRALNNVRTQLTLLTAKETALRLAGRTVTYRDDAGMEQTLSIPSGEEVSIREMVVYPMRSAADPNSLELHLAWEASVGRANPLMVYIDAVTGDTLAAAPPASPDPDKAPPRQTTTAQSLPF